MSELPITWVDVEIGEIAEVIGGGTPKANVAENFTAPGYGIAWLTPADLSGYKAKEIARGARDLTLQGYQSSSAKLMPKGSLLFSSRAPIGYVAVAANEIATNQGFKSFVFPNGIDPSYAFYYLKSIRELADSLGTGTTFKELSSTTAKTLPFRLAPSAEQTRIAAKLDELLAQVDTLKARIDGIPALLKSFRQSVLAAAVSGRLTEEWRISRQVINSWGKGVFTEFFDIQGGTQPPKSTFIDQPRDGYVQLVQIRDFGDKPVPTFVPDSKGLKKFGCDDFLIGRYGASVGRICTGLSGAYNVALAKVVVLDSNYIFKPFLGVLLRSPSFQSSITGFERSAQDGFNKSDLSTIEVALPLVAEQTEIVRRVEQLFAFADQLEAKVDAAKTRIDRLTQSILAKAFRGELVPQDPNDEPASVLLERIKAQRATAPKAKRGRRAATPS